MDKWDVIAIRTHLPPPERAEPRGRGPRMIHPTQAEFAAMLGVSLSAVSYWEQGSASPNAEMQARLRALVDEHDGILKAVRKSAETLRASR